MLYYFISLKDSEIQFFSLSLSLTLFLSMFFSPLPLFLSLSICLPIYLCIYVSVYLSVSISLSVSLSVSLLFISHFPICLMPFYLLCLTTLVLQFSLNLSSFKRKNRRINIRKKKYSNIFFFQNIFTSFRFFICLVFFLHLSIIPYILRHSQYNDFHTFC